ncbi:hypothetical protein FGG08_003235 [Glutinoglossum americanum]|uniref:Uncharacterized protein n=1 Tax=Glutinoglossum americanum TaxID=1670608 RepID=A0A9P8HYS2_9PEZI|nr:hypothetical protein FGG08_003235 [Glutinoglossum americanum]
MSTAVVANSLSSLIALSSNPPKYPRHPSQEVLDPLVLYIARVPGSKDIFLTTLKPRQKTVTAEDVTSSLYYMHVNQLEDDLQDAKGSMDEQPRKVGDISGKQLNRVGRKPLPPYPQLPPQGVPEPPQKDHPSYQYPRPDTGGQPQLDKKPATSSAGETLQSEASLPIPSSQQRRPLGPRPIGYEYQSANHTPGIENLPPSKRVERRPVLPPRPGLGVPNESLPSRGRSESPANRYETSASGTSDSKSTDTPNQLPSRSHQSLDAPVYLRRQSSETVAPENVSITLIRRDPGSGGQWNVGTITITSALDGSLSSGQQRRSPYAKPRGIPRRIIVEITNPGYSKFLPPKRPPLYATPAPEGTVSAGDDEESVRWKDFAYLGNPPIRASEETNPDDDEVFRREVWVGGAGFWDRNLRKRGSGSVDMSGTADFPAYNTDPSSPRINENERPGFGDSGSDARRSSEAGDLFAKPMAKGDVFTSPWDGRCEFSTGTNGRSLKCKHVLPIGNSPARQVSELRFNLPTTSTFSSRHLAASMGSLSGSEANRSSVFSQGIRKHLLASHHRRHGQGESPPTAAAQVKRDNYFDDGDGDDDDDDADVRPGLDRRLSIELGQEKAGGGPGGKRTKLGKLIVEDEGLRMLDLVVAVNMGLWWRAWEKIDCGDR